MTISERIQRLTSWECTVEFDDYGLAELKNLNTALRSVGEESDWNLP